MQYVLTDDASSGVSVLSERLNQELTAGRQVLWLVSGGSSIQASVAAMELVPEELSSGLQVLLSDERYGPPGHPDSNWSQLLAAGFKGKSALLKPVLRENDSFKQAAEYYDQLWQAALAEDPVIVAQLGIGADGHLAGILPGSAAALEATAFVSHYQAPPYQRLTLTLPALKRAAASYSFVFGSAKKEALLALKNEELSLAEQPAQILKQLPEAFVYNDQVGEND